MSSATPCSGVRDELPTPCITKVFSQLEFQRLKLSDFQRKDAKVQRDQETLLLRSPFQWSQSTDVEKPRHCDELMFHSLLFFAPSHLCAFALKILSEESLSLSS